MKRKRISEELPALFLLIRNVNERLIVDFKEETEFRK